MSHFYGVVKGRTRRSDASRCGDKTSGLTTTAASWAGCIRVTLYVDDKGRDCFAVEQEPWYGSGINETLVHGVIGQPCTKVGKIDAAMLATIAEEREAERTLSGDKLAAKLARLKARRIRLNVLRVKTRRRS